jgi:8-oxo-dGTP pyrophosphatase MutT (NUDIX family)
MDERQNYLFMEKKIYYNSKFISFATIDTLQKSHNQPFKTYEQADGKKLRKIVDDFLETWNHDSIVIEDGDFEDHYYIEAAGGLIEKENKFLIIHRLGKWDLPKGKLEKNETIPDCAIRECEEECGVSGLKIIRPLASTYHIYPHKKSFALKQSFWFYMQTSFNEPLKAQTEENIDRVEWFSREEIASNVMPDTYFTIQDVLREGLAL